MSDVLVLNFTYEALNITDIERAIGLLFKKKAEIVIATDGSLRSPSKRFPVPSIIRLLRYIRPHKRKRIALNKRNLVDRDGGRCGYCGIEGDHKSLTVDHVLPKHQGGPNTWENVAAACKACNNRKDNRTPAQAGMTLRVRPKEPPYAAFFAKRSKAKRPESWAVYLFA